MKSVNNKFISMKLNNVFNLKKVRRYEEAESILLELMEDFKDNLIIKKSMADLMLRQNRLSNALLLIDELLKIDPNDPEAMIIKGCIFYKKKRFIEARDWFHNALNHKDSDFCLQMLVKTMIRTGSLDDAMFLFEKAIKGQKGENKRYQQLKAEILEARGEIDEAIKTYEMILNHYPQDKFSYKELIRLKTERMDSAEATQEIDTLLKVSSYSKNEHLYMQQAENYKKQKMYKEAIDIYKKGLNISPSNIFIKKQIGFCYNKLKEYDQVIIHLKDAFLQEPADFILRKTLFAAYKRLDRSQEIIDLIESLGISGTALYYAMLNQAKK